MAKCLRSNHCCDRASIQEIITSTPAQSIDFRGANQRLSRFERMLSAYTDDRPFSLDLAGAVTRQYKFVEKMYNSGWTSASFFDDSANELIFTDALARYHG